MSPFRFHDDDSSTGTTVATALLGALAGFAVGMYVAQRVGGLNGLTKRFRRPITADATGSQYPPAHAGQLDEVEDEIEDEAIGIGAAAADADLEDVDELEDDNVPLLEERVLEAFNNDPILAERAIDIGAIGEGVIELAGWVDSDDEAQHAMTIARGVPGVETVVNRLLVDDEEHQLGDNLRRFKEGDAALADSRWEGQQVGTGKRRQGSSDEPDRHADPKPKLEDRWLSESEAVKNAADDIDEISAERRKGRGKSAKAPKVDEAEPLA
jgi:hypothetical protein